MFLPKAAFVVEIDDADPAHLCGRVEHVLSGLCGDFDSDATLVQFIRQALVAAGSAEPPSKGEKGSVR